MLDSEKDLESTFRAKFGSRASTNQRDCADSVMIRHHTRMLPRLLSYETDFEGLKRNSSFLKAFNILCFFSSCNNQPRKSDRRTTNSIKQMANPSLCYSQHHPLSGGISERVVTQESHPSSGQAS